VVARVWLSEVGGWDRCDGVWDIYSLCKVGMGEVVGLRRGWLGAGVRNGGIGEDDSVCLRYQELLRKGWVKTITSI